MDVAQPIFSPLDTLSTLFFPSRIFSTRSFHRRSIYLTADFHGTNEGHPHDFSLLENETYSRKNIDWIAR